MSEHKHAAVLRAIADGKEVDFKEAKHSDWKPYDDRALNPLFHHYFEWRVKPKPKPDVVAYRRLYGVFDFSYECLELQQLIFRPGDHGANIKHTFDGETGKLKSAEVLE